MKKLYIITICVLLLGIVSCKDYLDILPDDTAVLDDAFADQYNAEKYFTTCYSSLPNFANFQNTLGLNGADEVTYDLIQDNGLNVSSMNSWNSGLGEGQTAENPYMNFWNGARGGKNLWVGIRHCNIFLEKIEPDNGGPLDVDPFLREQWVSEVKVLKAYYHYYLFELYGPIPIIDAVVPTNASGEELNPYRESVDDVIAYVVKTIDEALPGLRTMTELDPSTEYGRITKTIALSIKAKALVLAASPMFNGSTSSNAPFSLIDNKGVELFPQAYDANKWLLALAACDSVVVAAEQDGVALHYATHTDGIQGGGVGVLDPNLINRINLRQAVTDPWNSETIWGTNQNTIELQRQTAALSTSEWNNSEGASVRGIGQRHGPTLRVVEQFYSKNGVPIEQDQEWKDNDWYTNRYSIGTGTADTQAAYMIKNGAPTPLLHFNRSERFYASVGFQNGIWEGRNEPATRFLALDFRENKGCGSKGGGSNGGGYHSPSGYLAKKMAGLEADYSPTKLIFSAERYSFPIIRLADMYLLLAECLNEVGGVTKTSSEGKNAYYYLDAIRARVGLEGVVSSWANYAIAEFKTAPNDKNGLRDIIRRERLNELAFEGARFYDTRRWLTAESLMNQPIRGWNMQSREYDGFFNIRILNQPEYSYRNYLMPIRQNELLKNTNLVQNPGW